MVTTTCSATVPTRRRVGPERTRMSRAGKARGFTLLELLVVLTIIACVLAIVPLVSERGAKNTEMDAAARVLVADLRALRQAAIRERRETSLAVDAAGA